MVSQCKTITPIQPIVLDNINGVKYCARSGGRPYANAIRPVVQDTDGVKAFSCPKGTILCNPGSLEIDPMSAWCIDPENGETVESHCPITDVSFSPDLADGQKRG